ncbi:MAG: RNA 2',3'-cyclic phosphodiesterase [Epsilonproteobacteria bacterium]|nr:RNA 2',3'-cyclic phosphodiesterase [Campylobacterota bacterium]
MIRCFIAIKIPDDISKEIADFCNRFLTKSNLKLKSVPPDNYHITLKFLGDTGEDIILPIESELDAVSRELETRSVSLGDLLFFPSGRGRGSIVIRVDGNLRPAAELINEKMEKFGCKKTKIFAPHVTVFRLKESGVPLLKDCTLNKLRFRADSFSLFESTLTSKGSIYKELSTFRWRKNE